ncbi:MAG: hypothetical protein LBI55_00985 [Oscillospiraceae bacterium]|nr:hypothetical protein [Oscillospiraceae bacterium]
MTSKRYESQESIAKFTDKLVKNKGFKRFAMGVGISGILLIFLPGFLKTNSLSKSPQSHHTTEQYVQHMQNNLGFLVSKIEGAGEAQVLVTLENGSEIIYAKEEKKNKESLEDKAKGESSKTKRSDDLEVKYITVKDSDGTEKALATKELEPKVKGVVVVCSGGNRKEIRNKVIEVIKTALDISENHICVTN